MERHDCRVECRQRIFLKKQQKEEGGNQMKEKGLVFKDYVGGCLVLFVVSCLSVTGLRADDDDYDQEERSINYQVFEDIANPFGGGSAIGLAHSILCVRSVEK